jgi:hypothetical protein
MIRPISVTALPDYRIHIAFSDAVEGKVDLSDLPGQGVFEAWKDQGFFERVHLGPAGRFSGATRLSHVPTPRAWSLVREWSVLHQDQLLALGERARQSRRLFKIEPLA